MRLSNCTKLLSFALITMFSAPYTQANPSATAQYQHATIVENLLQQAYKLPLKIDRIVENLALLVSKHQIRNLKNKDAVIEILRDVRMLLSSTLKDQATINSIQDQELQAQITLALLQLCDSLSSYLDSALKNNLVDIEPFDISTFTKRRIVTDLSPEQLHATFSMVNNKIDKLNKKTETAGLTWYNIATRKLEHYVIKPCQQYNIPSVAIILGATAALTTLAAWRYGSWWIKSHPDSKDRFSRFIKSLHTRFGEPLPTNRHGIRDPDAVAKNPELYGSTGILDAILTDTMSAVDAHSYFFP